MKLINVAGNNVNLVCATQGGLKSPINITVNQWAALHQLIGQMEILQLENNSQKTKACYIAST